MSELENLLKEYKKTQDVACMDTSNCLAKNFIGKETQKKEAQLHLKKIELEYKECLLKNVFGVVITFLCLMILTTSRLSINFQYS